MDLEQFDVDQIQRVIKLLESYGIEPTEQTLQALAKTADSTYPGDPDRLEKATRGMLGFFVAQRAASPQKTLSWNRFRQWAASLFQ